MNIRILSSAFEDLSKGRVFYEKSEQRLGDYFLNTIFSDIDSLSIYAGIHQKVFGYHRMLSSRFPYAIYYKIEERGAVVYRVLDCRQNPNKIRLALK